MLETAIRAAKEAGEILKKYFETSLERRIKDDKSIVTVADEETEKTILSILKEAYPDHGFLAEESGTHEANSDYQWIIDPVDGTTNFANGIPIFGISIALLKKNEQLLAVIYNPVTSTLFFAEKGKGTFCNGYEVKVSEQDEDTGLITIGTSSKPEDKDMVRKIFYHAKDYVKTVRYLGSAVLELGYVARGGTEAFINLGTKKWDYAAGTLLVLEAGGTITDLEGNPWNFEQNYFVASNGRIHDTVLNLVRKARSEMR